MPEEKKEKFTFSDKIKASKSAGSKSFTKPVSKIGKDGKPKQTLFERTRRDAPFFIAALVALLLLPFLYKYSGSSSEEELLVPVSGESIFNPDQFGFDTAYAEDPDGQIAQLSGRDSLSLIRGFGSGDEDNFGRDDLDFDASSSAADYGYDANADGKYAAAHHESSDMDIEDNTTNIYKRRAKKATRAAFRRAATKIGSLNPAAMRRPGGAGLNVKNWGGGIKTAAQKVKPSTPAQAPKPVSLQPLRAKSGRSSFGGTGKAGRASRDALGKADARQALRDANVKPVDPTRVGGLDMFSMGPGGGNGRLERNINIGKGQEPWWWDMMKTRMQKEWEKRFERKWKWIDWADEIAMNILKGLINCILTGDSDGDVDHFLGDISVGGSDTGKKECCGYNEKKWAEKYPGGHPAFTKTGCDAVKKEIAAKEGNPGCGWVDKTHASVSARGPISQRLCCLGFCGAGIYAAGDADLKEGFGDLECASLDRHHYSLHPQGKARKWNVYHYIVARNYVLVSLGAMHSSEKIKDPGKNLQYQLQLCSVHGNNLKMDRSSSGSLAVKYNLSPEDEAYLRQLELDGQDPENGNKVPDQVRQEMKKYAMEHKGSLYKDNNHQLYLSESIDPESLDDACVIYVAHGKELDWETGFKPQMINLLAGLIVDGVKKGQLHVEGITSNASTSDVKVRNAAEHAFNQLDLMFIQGMASKKKLGKGTIYSSGHRFDEETMMLPMPYWQFYAAYLSRYGSTLHDGSRKQVSKRKERTEGVDTVYGAKCYFETSLGLSCKDDTEPPQATVVFKPSYKGGQAIRLDQEVNNVVVTAQYKPLNGDAGAELNMHDGIHVDLVGDRTLLYTLDLTKVKDKDGKSTPMNETKEGFNIVWKVDRGASTQDQAHSARQNGISPLTATCTYNLYGDVPTPPVQQKQCQSAQESPKCCDEIMGNRPHKWDPSKPVGSQCVEVKDECPQGKDTNEKCCKDKGGADYVFDPNHNPKCYLPENIQLTRLAPVLSWVPSTGKTDCRKQAGNDVNPTESTFADCTIKIPGVVKDQNQHCGSQTPMMMDSEAAAKFVKDVVVAYNNNLPKGAKKLSDKFYGNTYPTDGEFVDALFIAAKNSSIAGMPQQVPAAAVCELGRDMVRMSRDKHTKEMQVASPLDTPYGSDGAWKESNTVFHNELGAFLAYIHLESLFYPQKFFGSMQQCDYRFQVTGEGSCQPRVNWSQEQCKYTGNQKCKEYHHNNYNNIPSQGAQAMAAYPPSLAPIQTKGAYLLKGLVSGKTFPQVGSSGGSTKGKQYINNITLLLREANGFEAWQGKACVAYEGTSNMLQVSDVLKYVETACSVGLDFKPSGSPGSRGGTSHAPGAPGSDTGTPGR